MKSALNPSNSSSSSSLSKTISALSSWFWPGLLIISATLAAIAAYHRDMHLNPASELFRKRLQALTMPAN